MNHQISIHPADFSGVHIGDLQDVVVLWVPGTTSAVEDMPHPPVLVLGLARQVVASDDNSHPWLHIPERVGLSSLFVDAVINGHGTGTWVPTVPSSPFSWTQEVTGLHLRGK